MFCGLAVHSGKEVFGKLDAVGGLITGGEEISARIEDIEITVIIESERGGIGKQDFFYLSWVIVIEQRLGDTVGGSRGKSVVKAADKVGIIVLIDAVHEENTDSCHNSDDKDDKDKDKF